MVATLGVQPLADDPTRPAGQPTPVYDIDNTVVRGLEAIANGVRQRLRFWRGTYFLDEDQGVPYLRDVVGHGIDVDLATAAITDQILSVPGVVGVDDVTVTSDTATRTLTYRATVRGDIGQITVEGTIG